MPNFTQWYEGLVPDVACSFAPVVSLGAAAWMRGQGDFSTRFANMRTSWNPNWLLYQIAVHLGAPLPQNHQGTPRKCCPQRRAQQSHGAGGSVPELPPFPLLLIDRRVWSLGTPVLCTATLRRFGLQHVPMLLLVVGVAAGGISLHTWSNAAFGLQQVPTLLLVGPIAGGTSFRTCSFTACLGPPFCNSPGAAFCGMAAKGWK